jgi:hypothetical protein
MKTKNIIKIASCALFTLIVCACVKQKEFDVERTIYVNHERLALYFGDEVNLTASPSSGTYSWATGDSNIASVNSSGQVQATGVGTTYILVTNQDGTEKEIPVVVTIPNAQRIIGRPGRYRAAVELEITIDRIKDVKITRMDTLEEVINNVDFQTGTITAYFTGLNTGRYQFRVVCIDEYGNESTPTILYIIVYGDEFQARVEPRPIRVITTFGNGLVVGWQDPDIGDFIEFEYTDVDGQQVMQRIEGNAIGSYLLDFRVRPMSNLSYVTIFLPEETSIDEFRSNPVDISHLINDMTIVVDVGETIILAGHFDLGGEGIGFSDADGPRKMNSLRPDIGDYLGTRVDIEGNGGIGYTNAGEWQMYTVYVETAGIYEIDWHISANGNTLGCYVEVNGIKSIDYPMVGNGAWGDWRYYCEHNVIDAPRFNLEQGLNKVRYYYLAGNFNYNGLRIKSIP